MTRQAPEGNENTTNGYDAEVAACERWPLTRVPDDKGNEWWLDARACESFEPDDGFGVVESGTPVDVKRAAWRIDAAGRQRRGRWMLRERAHDRLAEQDGEYALVVSSPNDEGFAGMVLRPAWWVDKLVTAWSPAKARGSDRRVAQIPWSRAFDEIGDGVLVADNAIQNAGVSA